MKPIILAPLLACLASVVLADEGMWTIDNFPSDVVKAKYDVSITNQWLQAAQTGTAPILLRVDPGGGHGDQPSRAQWLERTAHRLAFFAAHLGL